jgi:ribosome-binding factor A
MIPANTTTKSRRHDRSEEIIAHEAAKFIAREANSNSLITVIRAISMAHGERMNVFVSVFPEEKAQDALAFLSRQRETLSEYLKKRVRLSPLPRIDFLLENGEHLGESPKN